MQDTATHHSRMNEVAMRPALKPNIDVVEAEVVNCLAIPALTNAPGRARRHARMVLGGWDIPHLVDTAELVVSELVTNAVKATGMAEGGISWAEFHRLGVILLCVYPQPGGVVVEVWDRAKEPPVRRRATEDDEGGRGLELVAMVCARWGYRWPKSGGKWVWAALSA